MCPACRYKRCLEIGMSKEGIKTGRYSYAKRTQDILELKALGKYQSKEKPVKTEVAPLIPATSPPAKPKATEKVEHVMRIMAQLIEAKNKLVSENENQVTKQYQSLLLMQKFGQIDPRILGTLDLSQLAPGSNGGTASTHFPSFRLPVNLNPLLKGDGEQVECMRQWAHMLGGKNGALKNLVDYIKAIPGFRELPMNDQILLIKHCVAEVWLIGRYPMFNVKEKQYTSAAGITLDLKTVVGSELADIMCSSAVKLQKLQMDEETNTLLSVFVVVAPDRTELEARDQVEAIQENLLEVILFVLKSKYGDMYMLKFAHLAEALTELRNVTELYLKLTNTLITKVSDMPPLLTEMLSLS